MSSIKAQVQPFVARLRDSSLDITRVATKTLQINLGKLCNQTCTHCHVDAGPNKKRENMNGEIADRILLLADQVSSITTVDLTGGAPEMNPHFRRIVRHFRSTGKTVIDRCNLTVLFEPNHEDTANFLAENQVHVVASLPCYSSKNVNSQRGDGVFEKSIRGLQLLNKLGYGRVDSGLKLDLVYNPVGPHLPPDQTKLESDYKARLRDDFSIEFNNLLTITNMPIKRFLVDLRRQGKEQEYMELLVNSFNSAAAAKVMCRDLLSISWDGRIFDCDFNQMLDIAADVRPNIMTMESLTEVNRKPIFLADHCYGCTAGSGSSCSGSLN